MMHLSTAFVVLRSNRVMIDHFSMLAELQLLQTVRIAHCGDLFGMIGVGQWRLNLRTDRSVAVMLSSKSQSQNHIHTTKNMDGIRCDAMSALKLMPGSPCDQI